MLHQSLEKGLKKIKETVADLWCLYWLSLHEHLLSKRRWCGDKYPLNKQQLRPRLGEIWRHTLSLSLSEDPRCSIIPGDIYYIYTYIFKEILINFYKGDQIIMSLVNNWVNEMERHWWHGPYKNIIRFIYTHIRN